MILYDGHNRKLDQCKTQMYFDFFFDIGRLYEMWFCRYGSGFYMKGYVMNEVANNLAVLVVTIYFKDNLVDVDYCF